MQAAVSREVEEGGGERAKGVVVDESRCEESILGEESLVS